VSAEVSAGPRGCCERVGHLCCAGCGRQAGAGVWTPAPSALVPVQRKRLTGCEDASKLRPVVGFGEGTAVTEPKAGMSWTFVGVQASVLENCLDCFGRGW